MEPLLFFVLVASSLSRTVHAWSNGYTTSMCASLDPPDGSPQTSASIYSVSATGQLYAPGSKIKVQITGSQSVRGYIMQAQRTNGDGVVGTWSDEDLPSQSKTLRCAANEDTVTHSTATTQKGKRLTFYWTPPADCSRGNIRFVATVAAGKLQYWTDLESHVLSCTSGTITTSTTTTTTAPPTQTQTTTTVAPTEGPTDTTTTTMASTTTGPDGATMMTTTLNTDRSNTTEGGSGAGTTGFCMVLLMVCSAARYL